MKRYRKLIYWFIIIVISILRLWLQVNLNYIVVYASIDDNIAILQTESLINGQYLGSYNMMTLAKGYVYPFFLYACHQLHIPYCLGLGILIVLSHLMMLKAFICLTSNRRLQLIFYCVISFIPISYAFTNTLYFYRISLTAPLTLIVISCLIILYNQTSQSQIIIWSLITGISLWCVMNCREDSHWELAFVIYALYLFALKNLKQRSFKKVMCSFLVIVTIYYLPTFMISQVNKKHYGISLLNDRVNGPFASMMKLMYSVADPNKDDDVWFTYAMLEKCIDVSPSLASIVPSIDHAYHSWAYVYFPECGCIKGDFMQWVMRTALTEAGYYHNNATETLTFIESINRELKAAFNEGKLPYDHLFHPSSSLRGISSHDTKLIIKTAAYAIESLRYPQCLFHNPQPIASDEWIKRCEAITGMSLTQESMNTSQKKQIRNVCFVLTSLYQIGTPVVSVIVLIVSLYNCFKKRKLNQVRLWVIGLLISSMLLVAMVTIFTTFLNPIDFYKYTTPYMSIMTFIMFLLIADFLETNV